MKKHPEQTPEEIYLGNALQHEVLKSSWRSTRLGNTPLMADGSPCIFSDVKPWFIQRSEVEAAIAAERINDKPWSAERIRVFESMLDDGAFTALISNVKSNPSSTAD